MTCLPRLVRIACSIAGHPYVGQDRSRVSSFDGWPRFCASFSLIRVLSSYDLNHRHHENPEVEGESPIINVTKDQV